MKIVVATAKHIVAVSLGNEFWKYHSARRGGSISVTPNP